MVVAAVPSGVNAIGARPPPQANESEAAVILLFEHERPPRFGLLATETSDSPLYLDEM